MECIFCKIIEGKVPNHTVYEDEHVLAFLDIMPHAKGHTVVVPKVHAENLIDLNEELHGPLFNGVKRSQERIDKVLQPEGYNVGWNHGEAGGQVVPHLHIHILPRWIGDGGTNMHGIIKNPSDEPVEEIAKKLNDA